MSYRRAIVFVTLIFLSACLLAGPAGRITGKITDSRTGEPIVGAKIQVLDYADNVINSSYSKIGGNYIIPDLPSGVYKIKASYEGYHSQLLPNITLDYAGSAAANFSLSAIAVPQPIYVVSDSNLTGQVVTWVRDCVTKEPLLGVNIRVEDEAGKVMTEEATGDDGGCMVCNIPVGTYKITASYVGYYLTVREGIRILPNTAVRLCMEMAPWYIDWGCYRCRDMNWCVGDREGNYYRNVRRGEFTPNR